jgi:hypothetical protein
MSVAFHVRFEVPSLAACCRPGKACASTVWAPHCKRLMSKKKRVRKRIITVRIK